MDPNHHGRIFNSIAPGALPCSVVRTQRGRIFAPGDRAGKPAWRFSKVRWFITFALTMGASGAGESVGPPETLPPPGLWPSDRLMELLIARWADDLSVQHELDDGQCAKAREAIVSHWSAFLSEHRSEFQPLLNEYFELRLELEPPDKKRVQAWAQKAIRAFKKCRAQVERTTEDFRKVLGPRQRTKFEAKALEIHAGLLLAEQRLANWEAGDFEDRDFWEPTRSSRRRREAKREEHTESDTPDEEQADPITAEIDSWTRFVRTFIDRYTLDKGQCDAARSCLEELKQRALAHRDRRQAEIAELERRIASQDGAQKEFEEISKKLEELYGPVDRMFEELTRRLDKIPTQAQRAKASGEAKKVKSEKKEVKSEE